MRAALIVATSMLSLAAGCDTHTFAPLMHGANFGAPGRMTPGLGAVHGAISVGGFNRGALTVSVPVSRTVRVEANGDGSEYSATGSGGLRFTHLAGRLAMDADFGFGAGAGGVLCNNAADTTTPCPANQRSPTGPQLHPDGRDSWERIAYGGYGGVGFGVRPWRWFEVYVRGRLQLTRATNVPVTLWPTALGGVQFKIGPIDLGVGVGWGGYFNERDQRHSVIVEAGITVPFRVFAE